MLFEWDSSKAATNKRKHKVSFELAQLAMETDQTQLSRYDRTVDDEDRWHTLAGIENVILIISHTYRENDHGEEVIRIISARKATTGEKAAYYER